MTVNGVAAYSNGRGVKAVPLEEREISTTESFVVAVRRYPKLSDRATQPTSHSPMSDSSITITVKFFAAYQDAYNLSELVWEFPENTPVVAVLNRCLAEHPQLEAWRNLTRFGINLQFAEPNTVLQEGDEVVLIPPVSGG